MKVLSQLVKMAVAWAISVCYVKFEKETMELLLDNMLDDFTYNKSLQKITESYRVSKEDKARIRSMKRVTKIKKQKVCNEMTFPPSNQ